MFSIAVNINAFVLVHIIKLHNNHAKLPSSFHFVDLLKRYLVLYNIIQTPLTQE